MNTTPASRPTTRSHRLLALLAACTLVATACGSVASDSAADVSSSESASFEAESGDSSAGEDSVIAVVDDAAESFEDSGDEEAMEDDGGESSAAVGDSVAEAPSGIDAPRELEDTPRPQAGLLTAGAIDDNLNHDYFSQLTANWQQGEGRNVPFVELRDRVVIDVLGDNGVGIGNTELAIADGTNETLVVTDSSGRAHVYTTWLGISVEDGLTVASDVGNFELSAADLEQDVVLTADGDTSPPNSLDVALVLDVTGSMSDELSYLTLEFDQIVARLSEDHSNVDMRFAVVVYRDEGDDFVTRTLDFTGDLGEVRSWLQEQEANGGGDFPEAMDAALSEAAQLEWSGDSNTARVLILNADAPPHNGDIARTLDISRDLAQDGVRLYSLAASGVDRNAEFIMRAMAATTGGQHLFLTADSGIGGEKLEPRAECYQVTGLDDLLHSVLATELAGERIEPNSTSVIRTVGEYDRGICA